MVTMCDRKVVIPWWKRKTLLEWDLTSNIWPVQMPANKYVCFLTEYMLYNMSKEYLWPVLSTSEVILDNEFSMRNDINVELEDFV